MVCLRFQLLAPWLRRAFYQVDTYAIVEEPAVHSGGKLAGIRVRYTSYWASNISRAFSLGASNGLQPPVRTRRPQSGMRKAA